MKEGEIINGQTSIIIDEIPYDIKYRKERINTHEYNGIKISASLLNYREPQFCLPIEQIHFHCDGSRIEDFLFADGLPECIKHARYKISQIIYDKVMHH